MLPAGGFPMTLISMVGTVASGNARGLGGQKDSSSQARRETIAEMSHAWPGRTGDGTTRSYVGDAPREADARVVAALNPPRLPRPLSLGHEGAEGWRKCSPDTGLWGPG